MQETGENLWLAADWPLHDAVLAGVSLTNDPHKPHGFNLALHVDDDAGRVRARRAALLRALDCAALPMWLSQVHGDRAVCDEEYAPGVQADAAVSHTRARMAVVMTADCLPVLLATREGRAVAAIHAGWPGLHKGIIGKTVAKMDCRARELYAWIGPGISAAHYEVDEPFFARFAGQDARYARFFSANRPGHYLADLPAMARLQLQDAGLDDGNIHASGRCSFADPRFFSHRRDGARAGRMASFIVRR